MVNWTLRTRFLWVLLAGAAAAGPRCEVRVLEDQAVLATCKDQAGRLECREGRVRVETGGVGRRFGGLLVSGDSSADQQLVCHLLGQKTIPEDGKRISVEVCAVGLAPDTTPEDQQMVLSECDQSVGRQAYLEAADWLRVLLPSQRASPHRRLQQFDPPADGWWPDGKGPWGGFGHHPSDNSNDRPGPFQSFNDTNADGIPDAQNPDSTNNDFAVGLGLGLGLGIGLPVLVTVVLLVWYCGCHHSSPAAEVPEPCCSKDDPEPQVGRPNYITIGSDGELATIKEEPEQASGAQSPPTDSQITIEIDGRPDFGREAKEEAAAPVEFATIVTTEDSGSREEYQPLP